MFDLDKLFSEKSQVLRNLPALDWHYIFEDAGFNNQGMVDKSCILGKNLSVASGATIQPFCVIEDNVIVGRNCLIRSGALIRSHTVIGEDCIIGHCAEIKNSYIMKGAKIQSHTFVGDSIIGRGARIGSGCITGNRRFDQAEVNWMTKEGPVASGREKVGSLLGDYVRLGANVTTNPGTVIGAYTWIAAGQVVSGFIADRMFIKRNGTIVENKDIKKLDYIDGQGNF